MDAEPSADGRPSVGGDPGKARQEGGGEEEEEENSSNSEQQTQESEVRLISPTARDLLLRTEKTELLLLASRPQWCFKQTSFRHKRLFFSTSFLPSPLHRESRSST